MSNTNPLEAVVKQLGLVCPMCPKNCTHKLVFQFKSISSTQVSTLYLCADCLKKIELHMQTHKGYKILSCKEVVIQPERVVFT